MTALAQPKSPRARDAAYLALVRTLPCCAPSLGTPADAHRGITVAHHVTGAGMALKADDRKTLPLCVRHHDDFHALRGVFFRMTKRELKDWQIEMVVATQAALAMGVRADFVDGREAIVTTGEEVFEARLMEGVF